ncbi:MAG: SDR family oxidoreductase [Gemmatimonadales bacterium]
MSAPVPPAAPVVLVAGATSAIGRAVAAAFARRGYRVAVAGRNAEETRRIAADLALRYRVPAESFRFDALAPDTHEAFVARVVEWAGDSLRGAVLCYGIMGDQAQAQRDTAEARRIVDASFTGVASMLEALARRLESRGHGFLSAIASVAGDRGRQSNYVYGSAKAGLAAYLSGLRQRLASHGVTVTTVKPGFVDTRMTFGLPGMFLVADPADVGERIARACERGTPVLYVPWFWRWIMLIIRLIPERVFARLKL